MPSKLKRKSSSISRTPPTKWNKLDVNELLKAFTEPTAFLASETGKSTASGKKRNSLGAGCPSKKASVFMGALIKSAPDPKDESDLLQKPDTKGRLKEDDSLNEVEHEFIHDQEPKQPDPDHEDIELGSADEGKNGNDDKENGDNQASIDSSCYSALPTII
ncbi:hypothetical protein GYMLUDRAFT_65291 [Collybiopsis luxurians FD-317 M1]|uniref:Uncharacterized protein n=1 Tax=Collybiopsis luxurians FD-317 M1 TaxID=944289 RepID=A0A0D0B8B6_9AGAR|nr:hypothetical protein GYMLUDRAFT_65291 [Collybiopsis luxurians FD-317 M1]